MPVKTDFRTEEFITSVALPNHGGKYTVIPHSTVIDETKLQLANAGFEIKNALYKTTLDGNVAQGIYHINASSDSELGMMFAWSNSYNKQMKFKCAVGAHVFVCANGMVAGDLANYSRKHMGDTALADVISSINYQIGNAKETFGNLLSDKDYFKTIMLSKKDQSSYLGQLYAKEEVVTLSQLGIIKREMEKPSFTYEADPNSLWSFYNHITLALKESHPISYLKDHQSLHKFFVNEFCNPILMTNFVEEAIQEEAFLENEFIFS